MITIAHLSDPHFGTVDPEVYRALLADLRARPPELYVLTGDVTQRARRLQFRAARQWLSELPTAPVLTLPGNHDIPLYDLWTRVTNPYRLYRHYITDDLEPQHASADALVICVNATRATRHKNGELSRRQIARTAERIRSAIQPFRIVATHQPLAVTLDQDVSNLARGAELALQQWIAAGADLLIGGHIHLPYCTRISAGARAAIVLQAGTALSRRTRGTAANSYNRIALDATRRCMRLERRDFDVAQRAFALRDIHVATASSEGWQLQPERAASGTAVAL
jgi:3',5'-cyclic AMP phosphodiesterase CpdA